MHKYLPLNYRAERQCSWLLNPIIAYAGNGRSVAMPVNAIRISRLNGISTWLPALALGLIIFLYSATPAAAQVSPPSGQIIGGDCVITDSGGVKCWGTGGSTPGSSATPTDFPGLSDIVVIGYGDANFCFVDNSGGLKCWGDAFIGLQDVTGFSNVIDLAIGDNADSSEYFVTVCTLNSSGGVRCRGSNFYGEAGDGTFTNRWNTVVNVVGLASGVIDIDGGDYHNCAVLSTGGVKCWGLNSSGQLGNNSTTSSNVPVDVVGITDAVSISAGNGYNCVVTRSGGVKCWGVNTSGRLGNGTVVASTTPVDVVGLSSGVIAVATDNSHTCAVMADGGVKCWGDNTSGQLGNGTNASSVVPVDVLGLSSRAVAVEALPQHSCAVLDTGGITCWGYGANGGLATGTGNNWYIASTSAMTSGAATILPGLSINKSAPNPNPPVAGEPVEYTITVENTGAVSLTNVTVTDLPSPSLTMTSFTSNPPGTCNLTTLKCTLNSALLPGGTATFLTIFDTSPTVGAIISNTAYVTADQSPIWTYPDGPTLVMVSTDTGSGAGPTADVAIVKSAGVSEVTTGVAFDYTLTVTNNGPDDATNVVATDVLPAGFTFNSASASGGGSCSESGGTVTCSWATLTNGATVSATINVTP